jgi:hypothetical protein
MRRTRGRSRIYCLLQDAGCRLCFLLSIASTDSSTRRCSIRRLAEIGFLSSSPPSTRGGHRYTCNQSPRARGRGYLPRFTAYFMGSLLSGIAGDEPDIPGDRVHLLGLCAHLPAQLYPRDRSWLGKPSHRSRSSGKGRTDVWEFPTLALGGTSDVGSNGRWLPTTASAQYASTLAQWFGLPVANLPYVLPYINNFTVNKACEIT